VEVPLCNERYALGDPEISNQPAVIRLELASPDKDQVRIGPVPKRTSKGADACIKAFLLDETTSQHNPEAITPCGSYVLKAASVSRQPNDSDLI
jgi:hypothetical protein